MTEERERHLREDTLLGGDLLDLRDGLRALTWRDWLEGIVEAAAIWLAALAFLLA